MTQQRNFFRLIVAAGGSLICLWLAQSALAQSQETGEAAQIPFPVRPADAPSGSIFQQRIAGLPRDQREAAVLQEIMNGNVPEFLRRLIPIHVEAIDDAGTMHVATYFVMPDYLAIGADDDFFRIPLTPASATVIADQFDASLITAKVSDDVFAAAQVKLDPKPLTKDRDTVATFWQHHQIIAEQLHGKPRTLLVAGIKKDVVLTNRLKEKPHKVAIYGWHESNSQPIQSLYVGHVDWYVDYSHGVRLMSQQIIVDDQPMKVPTCSRTRVFARCSARRDRLMSPWFETPPVGDAER